ncbi:MAG: patatin-like phospholipase family protein [Cellvibrionaceae bacterium]
MSHLNRDSKKKSISLVLGSGGARGLAHIGVIRTLEQQGYHIASVAGCSMGALVGGIYAAGKLDEFEQWVLSVDKLDMVNLLDIAWGADGLVKGDKIIAALMAMVGDVAIESLPIKYTAVAADISHEKEVWMNSGSLFEAIRASISLPMFFTPVKHKNSFLVDGGVLNPVPIAPTFNDQTDAIFAVNLGGAFQALEKVHEPQAIEVADDSIHTQIVGFINRLAGTNLSLGETPEPKEQKLAFYDVANQAFDSMQSTIARQKLAAYPPDHVIELPRNACGTLEFHRAAEMIALGEKKTQQCLAQMIQR